MTPSFGQDDAFGIWGEHYCPCGCGVGMTETTFEERMKMHFGEDGLCRMCGVTSVLSSVHRGTVTLRDGEEFPCPMCWAARLYVVWLQHAESAKRWRDAAEKLMAVTEIGESGQSALRAYELAREKDMACHHEWKRIETSAFVGVTCARCHWIKEGGHL